MRDCREVLKEIPDKSIDLVVTSPPYYQQREYGTHSNIGQEPSVDEYVKSVGEIFRLCMRKIRPEGSVIFNIGDKYEGNSLLLVPYRFALEMSKKVEDEPQAFLLNTITWVKPNPEPRQFKRRLVNATEPFFHFVKTMNYKYHPEKFTSNGNAKKELDRKASKIGHSYFEAVRASSELTNAQKELAYKELNEVIEEVRMGKIWSFRMKIKGIHSLAYGGYEGGRKQHLESKGFTIIRMSGESIKRDVIDSPILNLRYMHHPAMYPEYLVQEILNLTTDMGDVVLDPFVGSGTTAVVAKRMRRRYIGIEINPEYLESAKARLQESLKPTTMEQWLPTEARS
jgi:site-specific DNA-methyltransferase (adenine-specific)